jgi:membrane protein
MLIAPLLVIVSSSVMLYVSTNMEGASEEIQIIQAITPVLEFIFRILPYALVWLLFTLLYMIMPNTKVKFKYALIAGIFAGTLFQVTQWAYIHFQIGVSKYSALYGTFAALPLFLFWLQLSWLIVLLGAEVSFAYQNVDNYEFESESLEVSRHKKRLLSLLILHYLIKGFEKGDPPPNSTRISQDLGIPIRLVRLILFDLLKAGILVETVTDSPKDNGYLPGMDINRISIHYVITKLDFIGKDEIMVKDSNELKKLSELDDRMNKHLQSSSDNVLIKDISIS